MAVWMTKPEDQPEQKGLGIRGIVGSGKVLISDLRHYEGLSSGNIIII